MSPSNETQRLIDLTLARLRRSSGVSSDLQRAAWGSEEASLDASQLASLAAGLPPCVALDLSALPATCVFEPRRARVLLNLLILAAASLPAGGVVQLLGSIDDLFVRIEGPSASWPAGMGACLADEGVARATLAGGDSRLMPLTALLARAVGVRLSFLLATRGQTEPAILRLGG